MKTLILAGLMFIAFATSAMAQEATDFNYTGNYAENFGSISLPVYYSNTSPIAIGGANDDFGYASQFTISSVTNISSLDINAVVFGTGDPNSTGSTSFVYQLYSGTSTITQGVSNPAKPVPDLNTLLLQSGTLTFADTSASYDVNLPFNTTVQPGTYWLAESGNGPVTVRTTQGYIDPPSGGMPTAAVPELPTWAILGLGMFGFYFLKMRKVRLGV